MVGVDLDQEVPISASSYVRNVFFDWALLVCICLWPSKLSASLASVYY